MKDACSAFTPAELRKLRSFKDPYGIQRFLDDTPYHLADTAWSPRRVLREQTSHCLEGAIFAAAHHRLRSQNRPCPGAGVVPHQRTLGRLRKVNVPRLPLPRTRLSLAAR